MPGKTFKTSKRFLLLNFSVKIIYCLSDLENIPVFFKPLPYLKGRELCKISAEENVQNFLSKFNLNSQF